MARISRYDLDTVISKDDKFIGTDSSGSETKNFRLLDIAKFLNSSALISVNGQVVFKLVDIPSISAGEFKANASAFSSVTSFDFSTMNANLQNILNYLQFFEDQNILITQSNDHNNYAHYVLTTLDQDESDGGKVTFIVAFREGNGSLVVGEDYAMSFSPKGQTDKTFQSTSLLDFNSGNNYAQTITHNLNKFPSVTVVDSAGSNVIGSVNHLNKNSFTITFNTTFSAKVYAN